MGFLNISQYVHLSNFLLLNLIKSNVLITILIANITNKYSSIFLKNEKKEQR